MPWTSPSVSSGLYLSATFDDELPKARLNVSHGGGGDPDRFTVQGLRAVHAPGPTEAMFALWHPRKRALFLADLLTRDGRGPLRVVPHAYQDEPARTRQTVRKLHLGLRPRVLLLEHGAPVTSGAPAALAAALERDAARQPA